VPSTKMYVRSSPILDVDQTGPTTADDVEAILSSLKKVGCCGKDTDSFKIQSSTTDSGGAMTKEGLGDRLKDNGIATPDMLVGTCGRHNTQDDATTIVQSSATAAWSQ
jgi:hypothetical protein